MSGEMESPEDLSLSFEIYSSGMGSSVGVQWTLYTATAHLSRGAAG